jgi:hypothetical protein
MRAPRADHRLVRCQRFNPELRQRRHQQLRKADCFKSARLAMATARAALSPLGSVRRPRLQERFQIPLSVASTPILFFLLLKLDLHSACQALPLAGPSKKTSLVKRLRHTLELSVILQSCRSSFSAISKPMFATIYSHCRFFEALQDLHTSAPSAEFCISQDLICKTRYENVRMFDK